MIDCSLCGEDHPRGSPRCPLQRVGRLIDGTYRLEQVIGMGGMGAVYQASHVSLPGSFALKMLHARWADHRELIGRFYREARAAAGLGDPGIVQVRDIRDDEDGVPYLVMEMLRGRNVAELCSPHRMPIECAVEIARQVLDVLVVAHDRGVIHRDLKPNNLFLAAGQYGVRIKLLDFGFAKVSGTEAPLSGSGGLIGTIPYMSPEQAMDPHSSDVRSDLYSLGATLFELLTGAPSLQGNRPQMLARLLSQQARRDPKSLRQDVPAFLDAVVGKAMEFDAADRFQSAEQMRAALVKGLQQWCPPERLARRQVWLAELLDKDPDPARAATEAPSATASPRARPSWRGRRGRKCIPLAVLIAALGTGAWWHWKPRPQPRPFLLDMAYYPGGRFMMGSTEKEIADAYQYCHHISEKYKGDSCRADIYEREQPRHEVEISPFQFDKWEVTNVEFANWLHEQRASLRVDGDQKVRDVTGKLLIDLGDKHSGIEHLEWGYHARDGFAQMPVVLVTWDAASGYCKHHHKRLPTEAEWEYAAGGPEKRLFPWGNEDPRCQDVVFSRIKDGQCEEYPGVQSVRKARQDKTPNDVYDLGGNVAEWVMDRFSNEGYPSCPAPCKDPVYLPEQGGNDMRIYRGGSAYQNAQACRSAGRSRDDRQAALITVGFRCAADALSEGGPNAQKNPHALGWGR